MDSPVISSTVWAPHWHEFNPWKDRLVYVPIEELAECVLPMGGPDRILPMFETWSMIDAIAHWTQYGLNLDGYIVTEGPILQAGIRFGAEPEHYLTPPFSLPKLHALLLKHWTRKPRAFPVSEVEFPAPVAGIDPEK